MNEIPKMSAGTNREWENSKENIQPNQQFKKSKMLKGSLSSHTEEVTFQQQSYESKLRLYSGEDPLPLWWEYIKWVEQNFPRGSCEKQTKELLERCFSVLSNKAKYFNDDRFVKIMIDYASLSSKPINVYEYMHSKGIGYNSAKFYINWSREVEKHGIFKQAGEILAQGLKRRAEPFEKLQSHYEDFKSRLSIKSTESSERILLGPKNSQSVDALTPKTKRFAPNSKYEGILIENEIPLPLVRQQQQNILTTSAKIHDSENINLPAQFTVSANLNFESCVEKNLKLSKVSTEKSCDHELNKPCNTKQTFDFYCYTQNDQALHAPKTFLNSDSKPFCPAIAIFEPFNPFKRPMYPKNKVYVGTVEFSLEEIRASEWLEKKKKIEQDQLLIEQQKVIEEKKKTEEKLTEQVEYLTKQVELLEKKKKKEQDQLLIEQQKVIEEQKKTEEKLTEQVEYLTKQIELLQTQLKKSGIGSSNEFNSSLSNLINIRNFQTEFQENSHIEKSVYERNSSMHEHSVLPDKMLSYSQQNVHKDSSMEYKLSDFSNLPNFSDNNTDFVGRTAAAREIQELFNKTLSKTEVLNESKQLTNKDVSERSFITTSLLDSNENFQPIVQNTSLKLSQGNLPFTFYCDPTATITNLKADPIKEVKEDNFNEIMSDEDVENVPPEGYVQDKTNRELAGVLQASKNILFIPLEEQQDESEDDCSDAEDLQVCHNERQFTDDTLIPPSNTEQFSTAKFLSSTPFVPRNNSPSSENQDHKIVPLEDDSTINHLSSAGCLNSAKKGLENDQASSELKSFNNQSCAPRASKILSTIMETSREADSKSSSNSSSSLTRSNNLEQLSSQGIQRNVSATIFEENNRVTPREEQQKFQIHITDVDPFDQENNQTFLNSVNISSYENLDYLDKSLRGLKSGDTISIGNRSFQVVSLIAEGAYAKVFVVDECAMIGRGDGEKFALKVCKNSNEWEFYICCELQRRLTKKSLRNSVMQIISAVKYSNAIALVSEYGRLGTLLDVINFCKEDKAGMPELVVMYFAREILLIVSELHEHGIIHGDIKPDNFLLANNAFDKKSLENTVENTSLQLIDFGRAIDLRFYDKGVCFTSVFSKAHFKCNEMKDNKPWVFQLDWYGVASCIHTMLFSDYMTVKKVDNVWEIEKKLKRYWCTSLWSSIFYDLLNIPECYQEQHVKSHIGKLESKLKQNSDRFFLQFNRLATLYTTAK